MGHDLQECTARVQNILHIAHGLREATAASNSPGQSSFRTSDSLVLIDSINLPSPCPLLPSLLEAGASSEVASAVSQIYQRRAKQLKQGIQESITTACHKAAEFPTSLPPDLLVKKLSSIFTEVYIQRLEEWKEQTIQRIKQASMTPVNVAPRNTRTFNHVSAPSITRAYRLIRTAGIRSTAGALFRGKPVPDTCR
jgi:hypothetical protein